MAQLVVHFMDDPVGGLREMARVTRTGGRVLASVWDHAGAAGPLSIYWRAVRDLDPDAHDESGLAGTAKGDLVELGRRAGLADVEPRTLTVRVGFATFEDWWAPDTQGWGRPARTSPGWATRPGSGSSRTVASCCPRRPSRSPPPRGACGATWPDRPLGAVAQVVASAASKPGAIPAEVPGMYSWCPTSISLIQLC